MAGSELHRRSQSFGGPGEQDAVTRDVHLAITYDASGNVVCYRNGAQYGKSFRSDPEHFAGGQSEVIFGMRHGKTVIEKRMLHGRILHARLYDRALHSEEVAASADFVSNERLFTVLDNVERQKWTELQSRIAALKAKVEAASIASDPDQHWIDLAHSILNMKEFIYVR